MELKTFVLACLLSIMLSGCSNTDPHPDTTDNNQKGNLEKVASFDHQVTGVTVSKDNRIFVNFPRWTEDSPISVAEVLPDGSVKAYPNNEWNSWRNSKKNELTPDDHFICVQSVVVDHENNLWVLDPAAPATDKIVPGGPKLVEINLATNQFTKTILFDSKIAPQGSYLNDIRFSPDGKYAYITDSGAKGAIVVVNLSNNTARRLLDGAKETQVEKDVKVMADGKPLKRPDGRGPEFAADGIALSNDGNYLFWQATTGKTLYKIPTAALQNTALSIPGLEKEITIVGKTGVADGLWMDKDDSLYITSPEDSSIKLRKSEGQMSTFIQDERLRWPDTLSQGQDGAIYVTTSHIQDSSWFKPDAPVALPTELWKIRK